MPWYNPLSWFDKTGLPDLGKNVPFDVREFESMYGKEFLLHVLGEREDSAEGHLAEIISREPHTCNVYILVT